MPRPRSTPKYRKHKPTGQAVVTLADSLGNCRDVYLGVYGSKESQLEYARVIGEWEANGRRLPQSMASQDISINELLILYWEHATKYYVKNGQPTSEQEIIRQAMRFVKQLYGHTLAKDFGPLALKSVRQAMVDHPITRKVKVIDPVSGKV